MMLSLLHRGWFGLQFEETEQYKVKNSERITDFSGQFLTGTIVESESEKVARLQMTNSETRQIQIMNWN